VTERPAAAEPVLRAMPAKARTALIAGATLVLGVAAGGMLWSSPSGTPSLPASVSLHVPGAISVHVYCGGKETFMTPKGEHDTLSFAPDGASCDVEAPLSPVMPLRGRLQVGDATRYRCVRQGVDLICGPAPDAAPRG
jgi:hypothetical protein